MLLKDTNSGPMDSKLAFSVLVADGGIVTAKGSESN